MQKENRTFFEHLKKLQHEDKPYLEFKSEYSNVIQLLCFKNVPFKFFLSIQYVLEHVATVQQCAKSLQKCVLTIAVYYTSM